MKNLLEIEFLKRYTARSKWHNAVLKMYSGSFKLVDYKACQNCSGFFRNYCGNSTFVLNSESPVSVLNIEEFLNGFPDIQGARCDLMLYDEGHKIVLADMYCGMTEYLEEHKVDDEPRMGKIEKARNQIESTLKHLFSISAIGDKINSFSCKYGIFAYRKKDENLFSDVEVVKRSRNAFLRLYHRQRSLNLALPMSCGFSFIAVQYPEIHKW